MTNQELLEKLKEDMEMRGFSHYTKDAYYRKAKETIEYFNKPMEEVSTKELREFLMKYLREKKKLSERSSNYYNSVIRFIYDVVLDKPINYKQIPMYKKKRKLPKILSDEELNIFFDACDNYMYKTVFMMIYGSGLRISEAVAIRKEDIDSKNMRLFVRNGKGERERYTVLPKASLEMLRKCYKMYKPNHPEGYMFLNYKRNPLKAERLRVYFRRYRRKAGISEEFIVHSLRHSFATKLIEEGVPLVQVKELLHTWGQTLVYHPHIHIIVPAGGIDKVGKWRNMKIRHYGLLGNRNKKTKLVECKRLTNTANLEKLEISTLEILKKTLGVNFNLCPICHKGHLLSPNSG